VGNQQQRPLLTRSRRCHAGSTSFTDHPEDSLDSVAPQAMPTALSTIESLCPSLAIDSHKSLQPMRAPGQSIFKGCLLSGSAQARSAWKLYAPICKGFVRCTRETVLVLVSGRRSPSISLISHRLARGRCTQPKMLLSKKPDGQQERLDSDWDCVSAVVLRRRHRKMSDTDSPTPRPHVDSVMWPWRLAKMGP
jgi:hypothetical protein